MDAKNWGDVIEEVSKFIKVRKFENDFEKVKAFFWQLGHTIAEKGGGPKIPSSLGKPDKVFTKAFKEGHNVVMQLIRQKKL